MVRFGRHEDQGHQPRLAAIGDAVTLAGGRQGDLPRSQLAFFISDGKRPRPSST